MKKQILAKLVTKYPGLSKAFLGLLADKMAVKVTEESGIDDAITALDNAPISVTDLAAEFQKEGDRRVTTAKTEWEKKNPPKPKPGETDDDADDDEPEETVKPAADKKPKVERVPSWAKELKAEVQALRSEKSQTTVKQKASQDLKDVKEVFWAKRQLPKVAEGEEYDSWIADVKNDWTEFTSDDTKDKTDKSLAALGPSKSGTGGGTGGAKSASKEEVSKVLDNIMP